MNYAQAVPIQSNNVSINTSALDAILSASPMVQLTLLALLGLSVLCWAVTYSKWKQLRDIKNHNIPFLDKFWKANSLEEIHESLGRYSSSSLAHVFRAGYAELQRLAERSNKSNTFSQSDLANVERALKKAIDIELTSMESKLTLLATTGSTGPFIGLFGTVWGIMSSFHKIGLTGNASLAVVAPGISEALVATAIGLAAAIPAVIMYNHFVAVVRKEEVAMNNFAGDFLNIAKVNFFKE